jgi:hypothetical protein
MIISAGTIMEGRAVLTLLNHNEEYVITQPNMYARFAYSICQLTLLEEYYSGP